MPRPDGVAQICNLLYRRFAIGRVSPASRTLAVAAGPQNVILRYSRLQICATIVNIRANEVQPQTTIEGGTGAHAKEAKTAKKARSSRSQPLGVSSAKSFYFA